MKILKPIIIAAGLFAVTLPANAIIAKRDVRTVTQPDGTTLNIRVVGDEFMHFTTAEDGTLLQLNDKGFYTFGRIAADGAVESSGLLYAPGVEYKEAQMLKDIDIIKVKQQRSTRQRVAAQSGMGLSGFNYPHTGSPKGLIILVQYSDVKFTLSNPADYFNDMINGENFTQYNGTGSALKYFTDQSNGVFTPSFDVYGPVTLPQKRSYYGANDRWGDDQNAHLMVTHAIDILDPNVNFSQYDTDKDGVIDNVYVIYAGQGEASYGSADTVWPHSYDVRYAGINKRVDGVLIGKYACSNEWEYNKPDGVGTFIHEFSHVMGLPDLYHTTDPYASYTPGGYSALDYGPYNNDGRTPPNYGAYERNAMGWSEPIMLDEPMSVSLNAITSGEFGLIPTSKTTEFFLLENRQQTGWDKYIPGHGMLIWHIDYNQSVFMNNTVNNTASHQYVDIVEANNNPVNTNTRTMAGWTFPGTSGVTEFTSSTTPALKDWNNRAIDMPITDIKEVSGVISFKVAGGGMKAPIAFVDPAAISSTQFVASWNPVEDATDYILSVYAQLGGANGQAVTGFDNKSLDAGWQATAEDYYDTAGSYGESSPSFKFKLTNQTLTSPVLDGDVSSIAFWAKGQSINSATYLTIDGLVDGAWVKILDYYPQNNVAVNDILTDIPAGVNQVRFVMHKSAGNIAIDDIVICYRAKGEVLPDYNAILTGGATSVTVDKLKDGVSKYFFTVKATDGKKISPLSEIVEVDLSQSGVENITTDTEAPVEYYNLQGIRIDQPAAGTVVIRRQGTDVSKIIVR